MFFFQVYHTVESRKGRASVVSGRMNVQNAQTCTEREGKGTDSVSLLLSGCGNMELRYLQF